jgi:hypothetical protein
MQWRSHFSIIDRSGQVPGSPTSFIATERSTPGAFEVSHRPSTQRHLAGTRLPIAHYQRTARLVTLASVTLDILPHFRIQRAHQHPPSAFAGQVVQTAA